MARALIVDTETPGFKKPLKPIEVASIVLAGESPGAAAIGDCKSHRYYVPGEEFEYGAMAVHNILPQDVVLALEWNSGIAWRQANITNIDYVIGHNVDFDCEVLGISTTPQRICTLALARFYYPDLDAHKLSAMMYYLRGSTNETREELMNAHSAEQDALNCMQIFVLMVERHGIHTWNQAYKMSEAGRMPRRMTFGKYGPKDGNKGMIISDMVQRDPGYVKWLKSNVQDLDPYLRKALDSCVPTGVPPRLPGQ